MVIFLHPHLYMHPTLQRSTDKDKTLTIDNPFVESLFNSPMKLRSMTSLKFPCTLTKTLKDQYNPFDIFSVEELSKPGKGNAP